MGTGRLGGSGPVGRREEELVQWYVETGGLVGRS
jgi:hypothetical protein